jgi:tetratricopeptide (TPR) repeat protein
MQQIEKHRLKSLVYSDLGNWQAAIDESDRILEIYDNIYPENGKVFWNIKIEYLAQNGQIEKAEEMAKGLKAHLEKTKSSMTAYWYAAGCIERSKGNLSGALGYFQQFITDQGNINCFAAHYMLARTYLELGRLGEAVTEFEEQLNYYDYWRLYWGGFNIKIHYYLGLAYEQSNWFEQAIQQYEIFLETWKDADPGIKEIDDARERLKRLKNRS